MTRKLLLTTVLILLVAYGHAQQTNSKRKKQFYVTPGIEILRSTHRNYFYSGSIKVNYLVQNGLEPGIGIEFASAPLHKSNNYTLRNLRFSPVYANLRYTVKIRGKISPFAETSLGISLNRYQSSYDFGPPETKQVSESGFYTYFGLGAKFNLSPKMNALMGVGFKGYKMSLNDLDINPHGVSLNFGVVF
ncbi:outer membrane beta-barrel protein [Pedobacter suwonensis]|uniref:outer membrane beta-barrel protein n=1 Tax=Pedobacter suwonensis TaxID=332999 RepID=UPI0011A1B542|nr:outer membrane beta-barrel protein [Pedobacter suwonensis]